MLAVLAYSAAFQVSFIADDFPQIQMSRTIAEPGGFDRLFANPGERLRITFFVLTYWVDRLFGFDPRKSITASPWPYTSVLLAALRPGDPGGRSGEGRADCRVFLRGLSRAIRKP